LQSHNLETFHLTLYTDSFPPNQKMLASATRTRGGFMHRCSSGFLITFTIALVLALTGCLGKNSTNPGNSGVQSVTLSPATSLSLDVGDTQFFSAAGKNAAGGVVPVGSIEFLVASGSPNSAAPLSIAANGAACAGNWDPTATQCNPGTSGIAIVTALINGVSSPPTTVYVHQHIASIQVTQAESIPPQFDCFSQGQTWQFQAIAHNTNGQDITSTVGPMNWSFSNAGVLTTDPTVTTLLPNQIQVTAKSPGITNLFAAVGSTTSSPYPYTTCLVQYIRLQIGGQGQAGNSITVSNGGSVNVTATVVDTLNQIVSNPPLTWSTTNPEVAAFGTTTSTSNSNTAATRSNLGGATLFASCTPPSCNIGVQPSLPIYASSGVLPNGEMGFGAISVDVTSTATPPTFTAWAATTGCAGQIGCSSAMFSVVPGATPIGAIVGVPRTPNSMMFNHLSAGRIYLGSDQGLMYVDVSASSPAVALVSNATTPCNVSLCGKVLTISNDGKLVVISDTVSTPSQVYIFNGGTSTAPIDLIIPGETATAAAFSPDQLKLFILTDTGKMYVYSTVDALSSVPIATTATDVKFSADGSFAYVSGTPDPTSISGYATCDTPTTEVVSSSSPITTTYPTLPPLPTTPPFALYPLPIQPVDSLGNSTEVVLALDPPNIDSFGVNVTQAPLARSKFVCTPPTVQLNASFPKTSINLGQGDFTPIDAQIAGNGSEMIIVGRKLPAVLIFNVANGTTTSIPLVGNPDPLSASASTDGSQVYVAACDQYVPNTTLPVCAAGSVHIVNTISQGDLQQVQYVNINQNNNPNMCNGQGTAAPLCLPNLIAIKPQ
jgi:hypothetical protein